VTAAAVPLGIDPAAVPAVPPAGGLRWVHDPEDDLACLHHLTGLHDLDAGQVVCHPTPGATWPVLIRNLLFHLLWRHELAVDVAVPLHPLSVVDGGAAVRASAA
jgi:hypothetical protein